MASNIQICNVALNRLGADIIRSFTEDNKAARACSIAYEDCRDELLAQANWTFARRTVKLAQVADVEHPHYNYVYQLPDDCITPYYIAYGHIRYGRISNNWEVEGDKLLTNFSEVYLTYVRDVVETKFFTKPFEKALAACIAADIAYTMTQDKTVAANLNEEAKEVTARSIERDASVGNTYRDQQEDPNYDTFVYPYGRYDEDEDLVHDIRLGNVG